MEPNTQAVAEQVIGFFSRHFDRIFGDPFRLTISEMLRRKAVLRQVEESSDAASQSLARLLINERLDASQAACLLQGLEPAVAALDLERIANPNINPEVLAAELLKDHPPCPTSVEIQQALLRVSLHSVVQVLTLVGPVMAEWRNLNFSESFELPRKIVDRLNRISEQFKAQGRPNPESDERFEMIYRDYLMQRFHRVDAGTVKMTTNLDVDLRELFVSPKVLPRKPYRNIGQGPDQLMSLSVARRRLRERSVHEGPENPEPRTELPSGIDAIEQIRKAQCNVLVGAPGSGKSTFLEWLQIQLAMGDEEFVMNGRQAIPLMLRIRELDIRSLPEGRQLIVKATSSEDRAKLMPEEWIERQMKAGRVLFMLDGLDECDPGMRDGMVLPWLKRIVSDYRDCRFLVSSRPLGCPNQFLAGLGFMEYNMQDFGMAEIVEYTSHWCTAVHLALNEPSKEARDKGQQDGEQIVASFRDNSYIRDLARNPLMLSAICLVNYFEGGKLPEDRAMLYHLCVEGLLHHWDQRRGIYSDFGLDEKLRVCRELALAMQFDDRAEYEVDRVLAVFTEVLSDAARATKLLEHIRYRAGLLVERRPNVFAFAHLTFQEYLAAQAIHEGNRLGINAELLVKSHNDARWKEVIALYCGLSTDSASLRVIENLITEPNTNSLGSVLAEAYRATSNRFNHNKTLRSKVIKRIALSPGNPPRSILSIFSLPEVSPIANQCLGELDYCNNVSEAYYWFLENIDCLDIDMQLDKLTFWRKLEARPLSELVYHVHRSASTSIFLKLADLGGLYLNKGPIFSKEKRYLCQAEMAIVGLSDREYSGRSHGDFRIPISIFVPILRALSEFREPLCDLVCLDFQRLMSQRSLVNALPGKCDSIQDQLIHYSRKILKRFPHEIQIDAKKLFRGWIKGFESANRICSANPKRRRR